MGYQMTEHSLLVKRLTYDATVPIRATPGSIGYDVFACLPSYTNGIIVPVRGRKLIPLGFSMHPPAGTYGRLAPRSGLAHKQGIHVMAGVIDPDYRGEVHALLLNTGDQPVYIKHGDRVAQLILEQAVIAPVVEVNDLDATERGSDGFGSTG